MRVIVSASGIVDGELLLRGLNGALVRNATAWILDIKATEPETPGANIADGPLPIRACVSDNGGYKGELIVWITAGRISGLEFAWASDEPPTRWPQPHEMKIEAHGAPPPTNP